MDADTGMQSTTQDTNARQAEFANGDDVVTFLVRQHDQIKALFQELNQATGDARADAFVELRRLLAVHETAEEEIVHPRARKVSDTAESVVSARLNEERSAKEMLASMEDIDVESAEFRTVLSELQMAVLAHAEAEEEMEFPLLADALEPDQLQRMQKAASMAEAMAPTRPHPGVESGVANVLVGPFAMMLDRARDALTGKTAESA